MIVGCYTMDLYCDDPMHNERFRPWTASTGIMYLCFPKYDSRPYNNTFSGRNAKECKYQAIRKGWTFKRDTCVCWACNEVNKETK